MLADLLARHATERPQSIAVIANTATEEHRCTWRELHAQTEALAAALAARGIGAGMRAALLLPNCPEFITAFLALARLGAIALPLSIELKSAEIRTLLQNSETTLLIADERFAELGTQCCAERIVQQVYLRQGSRGGLPSLRDLLSDTISSRMLPIPAADSDVLEQFTSGTTGNQKCIVRTHEQLLHEARAFAAAAQTSAADRILAVVPLSHAHGLGNALLAALYAGATLILQERFDRRTTLRLLTQNQITIFPAVPFMISVLADTRMPEPIDLSKLRLCFTAGSALRREVWHKARERFGICVRQLYGSTETGALAIDLKPDNESTLESVGLPLDAVRIAVLDEDGKELPRDSEGEVVVQSPAAAQHFWGSNSKEPLADINGWIHIGDLGLIDAAGRLHIRGRKALVIHVGGRKVNPTEVESVLMTHSSVREAVVVGLHDPHGDEIVKAVVATRAECTAAELLLHCREQLADYKVPRFIEFRAAIPRCPAGKVLRNQLLEPACAF